MHDTSIPAPQYFVDANAPRAIISGPSSKLTQEISLYFRSQGVAVIAENDKAAYQTADYAVVIGNWDAVRAFTAQPFRPNTKVLCIIHASFSETREVYAAVHDNLRIRVIIIDESDVPELTIDTVFSFFFGSDAERVWVVSTRQEDRATTDDQSETYAPPRERPRGQFETVVLSESEEVRRPDVATAEAASMPQMSDEDRVSQTVHELYPDLEQEADADGYGSARTLGIYLFRAAAIALAVFVLFVGYPLASFGVNTALAVYGLRQAAADPTVANGWASQQSFERIERQLVSAQNSLDRLQWATARTGFDDQAAATSRGLSVLRHVARGGKHIARALTGGSAVIPALAHDGRGVAEATAQAKESLALAEQSLAVAQAESALLLANHNWFTQRLVSPETINGAHDKLQALRQQTALGANALSLLPELVGLSGKRTYLVLFQNNMELRPTGGFIGSFGIVTFDQGAMGDFRIEDVYTADGQLKGHVEPPFAIKMFLGQERWYLRDSNWDPDFAVSGERAAWFLEKELGVTVDGVIAVDLTTAAYLLEATGPIQLPGNEQQISADNLFIHAQTAAQADFFPGSTQKKDFLGATSRALLLELTGEDVSHAAVFQQLARALQEKHVLLYFRNQDAQQLARNLGFGGHVATSSCGVVSCIADYLYTVDANLGVNKANAFVDKAVTNSIQIQPDGTVMRNVVLLYQNNSPATQSFPGGAYKDYLRVFVPIGSRIHGVFLDGEPVVEADEDEEGIADQSVYLVQEKQDKTVIGINFSVAPQSQSAVRLVYQLPQPLPAVSQQVSLYSLTVQKQPGTDADALRTIFEHPPGWTVYQSTGARHVAGASTLAKTNRVEYNDRLRQDLQLQLQLVPSL